MVTTSAVTQPKFETVVTILMNRWLDQGKGPTFAYFMAVYHGVCAALFYSTAGKTFWKIKS
jgi:hypothetical protein